MAIADAEVRRDSGTAAAPQAAAEDESEPESSRYESGLLEALLQSQRLRRRAAELLNEYGEHVVEAAVQREGSSSPSHNIILPSKEALVQAVGPHLSSELEDSLEALEPTAIELQSDHQQHYREQHDRFLDRVDQLRACKDVKDELRALYHQQYEGNREHGRAIGALSRMVFALSELLGETELSEEELSRIPKWRGAESGVSADKHYRLHWEQLIQRGRANQRHMRKQDDRLRNGLMRAWSADEFAERVPSAYRRK